MYITQAQREYFLESVVRDSVGELLPVYHGTGADFDAFDPAYTGQGNDQYGSGFYFTTSAEVALSYTTAQLTGADGEPVEKLGGADNPHIIKAFLDIRNPIVVDAKEHANLRNFSISGLEAEEIILLHPDIYCQPDDGDNPNPVGDYLEDFWENDCWTKEELEYLARKMARQYFSPTNMLHLDTLFRDYPTELRHAYHKVLGYDGVKICFDNQTHYVAWFPEQIKLVTNLNPTKCNRLDG